MPCERRLVPRATARDESDGIRRGRFAVDDLVDFVEGHGGVRIFHRFESSQYEVRGIVDEVFG